MSALHTSAAVLATCGALALVAAVTGPAAASAMPAALHRYQPGDFDGDGHRDLVIGAPGADRVRISYTHVKIEGSHVVNISPPSHLKQKMNFGTSFVTGDFNGDGYSDLAVTAPQYTASTKVGAVFVYLGSKSGLHATPLTIVGPGAKDVDGDPNTISLAAADVNGDGHTDLAVGTSTSVRIYRGYAHGVTSKRATTLPEGQINNFVGADSMSLGDFNGDHHPDLAIGRSSGDIPSDGETFGQLDIFYGTASGPGGKRHVVPGSQVGASGYYDQFAMSMAAGDFNGDGHLDLAIGTPGENVVTVLFGGKHGLVAKHQQIFSEQSTGFTGTDFDAFGTAVSAGRITGDGYSDLVVGAPGVTVSGKDAAGAAFVIRGSSTGLTSRHAQKFTMATPGIPGSPFSSADFGGAVYVGNFAGNAHPDTLIAAPTDSQSRTHAGYVVRLLGTNSGLTTSKATSAGSTSVNARFGTGLD